jgi:hypothetical protein
MWGDYMRSNLLLDKQIHSQLQSTLSVPGDFNIRFPVEIENNYHSGYGYLHGTRNFRLIGYADFGNDGNLQYHYTAIWHDDINPNSNYPRDAIGHWLMNLLFSPRDYTIRIIWSDCFGC